MRRDVVSKRVWLPGTEAACRAAVAVLAVTLAVPVSPAESLAKASAGRAEIRVVQAHLTDLAQEVRSVRIGEGTDAETALNTVTIVIAVAAGLVTLMAFVATVAGYRVFRTYIDDQFARHANTAYEEARSARGKRCGRQRAKRS